MAVSSGGAQGVGDVWVAAAPKGRSLVSAGRLPTFLCCQKSGPQANAGLGTSLSLLKCPMLCPGEGPTGTSLIQIRFTHPTEMAPNTWHQRCLEGFTEEDMGDTGKAVQGIFQLG